MKVVNKSKTQKTVKGQTIKSGECFLYEGRLYLAHAVDYALVLDLADCEIEKCLYRYNLDVIPVTATITYEVK